MSDQTRVQQQVAPLKLTLNGRHRILSVKKNVQNKLNKDVTQPQAINGSFNLNFTIVANAGAKFYQKFNKQITVAQDFGTQQRVITGHSGQPSTQSESLRG